MIHDEFVAAGHGVFVGLDVESVDVLMLAEPSNQVQLARLGVAYCWHPYSLMSISSRSRTRHSASNGET